MLSPDLIAGERTATTQPLDYVVAYDLPVFTPNGNNSKLFVLWHVDATHLRHTQIRTVPHVDVVLSMGPAAREHEYCPMQTLEQAL